MKLPTVVLLCDYPGFTIYFFQNIKYIIKKYKEIFKHKRKQVLYKYYTHIRYPGAYQGYMGNDFWKKFQIGSTILRTEMTNRKMSEMIDGFDKDWPKIQNFRKLRLFVPIKPSKLRSKDLH